MKKIISLMLSIALLMGVCACSTDGDKNQMVKVNSDGKVTEIDNNYEYKNDNVKLSITGTGIINNIEAGGKNIAQDNQLQAKISYSTASDMWKAKSFSDKHAQEASVSNKEDTIIIEFSNFEGLNIKVKTEIILNKESIYFYNTVTNNEKGTVVAVEAPYLQGIKEIENGLFYIPDRNGCTLSDPLNEKYVNAHSYRYPVTMAAQLYTYGSNTQTVSIRCEDKDMLYKEFQFGGEDNVMSVRQFPFVEKGKKASVSPVVIKCVNDSWHSASDDYGEWYHTWAKKPEHSSKLDNFPLIGETKPNWKPLDGSDPESITELVSKLSTLKKRGYDGSEVLTWWGGPDNPPVGIVEWQDLVYPDYRYPSNIVDKNGLADFADRVHSLGDMQVGFYTNARLGSQNSELLEESWKVQVANSESAPDYEIWWDNTYNIMCPCTDYLDLTFARVKEFSEAGIDFMQLDQIGAAHSFLCFGKSHGHSTPASAWTEGYTEYLEKVSGLTRANDTWFWTEGTWEGSSQYVQVSQYGNWDSNLTHFPEFYLYTFKTHKLFGGAWYGGIPIWVVSPGSQELFVIQNNADFYQKSEYHDDYGLTYDKDKGFAVWHKNGDRVMMLAKGNSASSSSELVVKLSKDMLEKTNLADWTIQGGLSNVTVSEDSDYIIMSVTLSGIEIGGTLITLE